MKMTKEMVLAGIDPKKVTMEDLKAFADEENLIIPDVGTKAEFLGDFLEQINARDEMDAPPDPGENDEDKDLDIPDAPPDPGENDEEGDIPPALKRRGIKRPKRVIRKKAELPEDAPPALRRRWRK